MSTKIHVGNLPAHVTDDDLLRRFCRFGAVSFAAVMKDELSGNSRGYGLVEMESSDGAEQAIKWLHFSSFEGQVITVSAFRSSPS